MSPAEYSAKYDRLTAAYVRGVRRADAEWSTHRTRQRQEAAARRWRVYVSRAKAVVRCGREGCTPADCSICPRVTP